jgi:hypothetical protein
VFHRGLLWLFHCVISGVFKQLHWNFDLSLSGWSAFWLLHLLQLIALNLFSTFERPAPLTALQWEGIAWISFGLLSL